MSPLLHHRALDPPHSIQEGPTRPLARHPSPKSRRSFARTLQHTAHFSCTRTRTLWVLYTSRSTALATKCENLEELACSAGWMLDRLYQNQGSGRALAGFRHLKSLRLFEADALSVTQIISAPITHLHLVEPVKGGMKAFLSDVAPSLHSLAHRRGRGRERIASGFQGLAAHDPRLSVQLNTIRANLSLLSVNSESPSMVHRSTVSARHRRGIECLGINQIMCFIFRVRSTYSKQRRSL